MESYCVPAVDCRGYIEKKRGRDGKTERDCRSRNPLVPANEGQCHDTCEEFSGGACGPDSLTPFHQLFMKYDSYDSTEKRQESEADLDRKKDRQTSTHADKTDKQTDSRARPHNQDPALP
eukprot:gnl/TRDRNA2_/TRDRNA2_196460_c0_seq1.p1 gnl/TRDRNA2_/TRDRNA2_196460_c0~~gnl/TRDRNA2_/TRDRNA2_196460_c0_seq1.p1  ORF type:complete len:120 (-),score=9.05 gnl/TRDRNA2_/TRDRNA2_196460_c0_seq1:66-425(-)